MLALIKQRLDRRRPAYKGRLTDLSGRSRGDSLTKGWRPVWCAGHEHTDRLAKLKHLLPLPQSLGLPGLVYSVDWSPTPVRETAICIAVIVSWCQQPGNDNDGVDRACGGEIRTRENIRRQRGGSRCPGDAVWSIAPPARFVTQARRLYYPCDHTHGKI